MRKVKTLMIGATMFSIGYALSHPREETLIIEKDANLLPDFIQPMNLKKVDMNADVCPLAFQVRKEFRDRFIMNDDGMYHNFLVSFLMGQRCYREKPNLLFMTEFLGASKTSAGYISDIFCADGFCKIQSDNIIDTTSIGAIHHLEISAYTKSICCMISRENDVYAIPENAQNLGGLWKEMILKYRLSNSTDIITAKRIAEDTVHHITGSVFLSSAACFAYDYDNTICRENDDGTYFIPSASYNDIIAAFNGGATWNF